MYRRKFHYTLLVGVLISISIYFGVQLHSNHEAQKLYTSSHIYTLIQSQPQMIMWHTSSLGATIATHSPQRWATTIAPYYTMAKDVCYIASVIDLLEKRKVAGESAIALYPTPNNKTDWAAYIALKPRARELIESELKQITDHTFAPLYESKGGVETIHYTLPSGSILSTCYYRGIMIATTQPTLLQLSENDLSYKDLSSGTKGGLLELSILSNENVWHNYALSRQGLKLDNLISSLEITPCKVDKDSIVQLSCYTHLDKKTSNTEETLANLINKYSTGRYEVIYKGNHKGLHVAIATQHIANANSKLTRIERRMRWGLQHGFSTPLLPDFCKITEPCTLSLKNNWVEITPTATTLPWQAMANEDTYNYLAGCYPLPQTAAEEVSALLPPLFMSKLWRAPLREASFRYTIK